MWFSAFALLLAAEPLPPSEIANIFTADDYPLEALERNETGTVGIEFDVQPNGRVTGCRITKSSRSALLDAVTCRVVVRRGRFIEAARQHGGKPFQLSTEVSWQAQAMGIPVVVISNKIIFTAGSGTPCRTESPEWMRMDGACEAARGVAGAAIAKLSKQRNLQGFEYVIEMTSIPGNHLADSAVGEGKGEELLGRQTALLTIAADGSISSCVGGEDSLAGDIPTWCGSFVKKERYEALPASVGNQSDRQLTKINAIYLRQASSR